MASSAPLYATTSLARASFDLGTVQVTARYLNHPGIALGFRLEAGGIAVVYATDHEPHSRHQPEAADAAQLLPVHREDQRHVEFLAGADLVIHDAQYTLEEYPSKLSWGHSPAELAVDFALAAGVKRLALFHHDPLRDDAAIDRLVERCRQRSRCRRARHLCCRGRPDDRASGAAGSRAARREANGIFHYQRC